MPEFLEYSLDKFIFRVASNRYYNADGVWALEENGRVRIGLSDFRQQRSGDIAFAEVTQVGDRLDVGEEVASIETIKVDISLPAPVSGVVLECNPALEMEPEIINEAPYGRGWLVVIEASQWLADQAKLLDAQAYYELMKREADEEATTL